MRRRHACTDRGSTLPLILGFFLIALLVVAGGVAASDAFVQQRALQDVCDGAAAAAVAGAGDIDRGGVRDDYLRFADVQRAVDTYLARDPARAGIHVSGTVSADATVIRLTCEQTRTVAFGTMFGKAGGVHHIAHASARARVTA